MRKYGNAYQNLQGPLTIGAATGGYQTAGTINAQGLFINGVAVVAGSGAGGVSSITGTANQIAASASTGAVTLSMPQNVIIPTPASGNALVVVGASGNDVAVITSVGSANGLDITNAGATNRVCLQISQSSGNSTVIGQDGGTQILPGTANGDFCIRSGQTIRLSANGYVASQLTLATAGNVTINAPSSGVALTATGASGQAVLTLNPIGSGAAINVSGPAATALNVLFFQQSAQTQWGIYQPASTSDLRFFAGADRVVFTATGSVTINAPTSGNGLNVTGVAGSYAAEFNGSSTASNSFGVLIDAGTNASDWAFLIQNQAASTNFLKLFGDGGLLMAAATGGDKGLGTINATGLFINGVAVSAGAGVSSITGTANQIAASASTGAVTLSFPVNVILPTVTSGTALTSTINGGGTNLTINDIGTFGASAIIQYGSSYIGLLGSNSKAVSGGNNTDIGLASGNNLIFSTGGGTGTGQGAAVARMTIDNSGGIIVGAAVSQGAGTLNALAQLYVNSVPIYRTGTFTGTLTGMSGATTGTVTYVINGNTAILQCGFSGTSNATTMTMTGLPAVLQPATLTSLAICPVTDNGSNVAGAAQIVAASGTITFFRDVLASGNLITTGFTATGTKGLNTTITYLLL